MSPKKPQSSCALTHTLPLTSHSDYILIVIIVVILCGILAVHVIYRYGVKNKLMRIEQYVRFLLLETVVGINPPVHKIKDYSDFASKWNIEKEWKKVVLKNNPSYQEKDFERDVK